MKPETYKLWEEALNHFKNAESQESAREATFAIWLGCWAIIELSKELEIHDLDVTAGNVFLGWLEKARKHDNDTPKQTVELARDSLKRLSDGLPPEIHLPLR